MSELQKFAPAEASGNQVQFNESLLPVVERIARVLPAEKVWEFFSSTANETGGVITFPYLRSNASLQGIQNNFALMRQNESRDISRYYKQMSEHALKAILWVEVGFEGLDNLAASPASRNWESIKTHGKQEYEQRLRQFVEFRKIYPEKDNDCFAQYNLEHLLDRWQEK